MRYPLLKREAGGRPLHEVAVTVSPLLPTTRRGMRSFTLHFDGRLTEDMEEAFAFGDCIALAMAIRSHTGWPLLGLWDGLGRWQHVAACPPSGLFLDIRGARSRGEVLASPHYRSWTGAYIRPMSSGEVAKFHEFLQDSTCSWTPLYAEALSYLAERLVELAGYRKALIYHGAKELVS